MSITEREQEEQKPSRRKKWLTDIAEYLAASRGGEADSWYEDLKEMKLFEDIKIWLESADQGYQEEAKYPYKYPDGWIAYYSVCFRHRRVRSNKLFIQCRNATNGTSMLVPGAGSIKIPYNWPQLIKRPDELLWFTEGEGNADYAAKRFGILTTTLAGQKWSADAVDAYRGRDVRVLEDNDAQGRENADNAVKRLTGAAKTLKVILLPGLPPKGDIKDWIEAGHTLEELLEIERATPLRINVRRWEDLEVPRQEWAVNERIPIGYPTLFSGVGAAGKSLLQLQLSVASVLGREWLNVIARRGPALFIDVEDGENVLHKRLADILNYYNARFADVADELHLVSLLGQDAAIAAFSHRTGRIEPTPLYQQIFEMACDLKPVIIGIASLANVFAGSEIDRAQVQQFAALLTRITIAAKCGLVLISHPSLTGIATKSGISGSTQWHNAFRARYYISAISANENGNGEEPKTNQQRKVVFKKNQYGPEADEVVVKYENGLFLPVEGATVDQAARMQQAEEVYLHLLEKFIKQNQDLGPSKYGNYAPGKIAEHPLAKGFSKADMEAAQQRLIDTDRIHIADVGVRSKPKQVIRLGEKPL
jgi:RecA-family ATPase